MCDVGRSFKSNREDLLVLLKNETHLFITLKAVARYTFRGAEAVRTGRVCSYCIPLVLETTMPQQERKKDEATVKKGYANRRPVRDIPNLVPGELPDGARCACGDWRTKHHCTTSRHSKFPFRLARIGGRTTIV